MEEANQILHKTGEKLGVTLQQVRKTTIHASAKVQSCFDARLGSLIAGIIMSVISGVAVLSAIGGFIFISVVTSLGYNIDFSRPREEYNVRLDEVVTVLILNAVITVGLIFSLMEFSFSVVLAVGASKKKTGHLKAYFIYGNVKSAMLFVASIVLFITLWDNGPGYLSLLVCGINVMITCMVYGAYRGIKKSTKGFNNFDNEVPVEERGE